MERDRWRTIDDLFQAALDRAPGDRAAFLEHACGTDAALRREVESLLTADAGASDALDRDVLQRDIGDHASSDPGSLGRLLGDLAARLNSETPPDITPRVQEALGTRFRIERELRGGGMGRVFVAEEAGLGRRVVVKVLAPAVGAELDAERFQREIRIAAGLQHPHILPVHSAGESGGLFYYTMPYVEGESLRQRVERVGPLPLPEAVSLLREIADALAYAHRRGIVHRDLKPANILFGEGHALIIDFGIAKALSAAADAPAPGRGLTTTGLVLGTPTYMAPEQAAGDPVDHRADLYAFGCVAYEVLAGRPPFTGSSAQEVIAAHLADDPEPVASLRPGLPRALAELVMHLLAKRPAERPASADVVLAALQGLDTAEIAAASGAPRSGSPRRFPPRTTRLPLGRIAGVAAGALLLAAAGSLVLHRSRTPTPPAAPARDSAPAAPPPPVRTMLAVLPFRNLGRADDEYFASGLTEEITSRLAGVQRLGVISGTSASQYKESDKSLQVIGRELGVAYVLEGSVRWDRPKGASARVRVIPQLIRVDDDSHLWSQRYDATLADLFDVQAAIAEEVARALNVAIAGPERTVVSARPTDNMEAYAYYLRGTDYDRGSWGEIKQLKIAMTMYARAVTMDPGFALAFAKLSQAHTNLFASTSAGRSQDSVRAMTAAETAVRLRPDLAEAHVALGHFYARIRKDYGGALREFALADSLQPNSASVIQAIGLLERRQGRMREAVVHLKRAAELDPRSAELAADIGLTDWFLRAYPESEQYLNRAIALAPDWVAPYAQKAWLYVSWHGDLEGARRLVRDAARTLGLGNLLGFMNPEAMFLIPTDAASRTAFEQLAPRDFEDDTALYALSKAEWFRLRGNARLVRVYSDSGRFQLEAEMREAQILPWRRSFLGYAYAGLGRTTDAVRMGVEAQRMVPDSTEAMMHAFAAFALARIYVLVGDQDAAVRELEHLLSIPSQVSIPLLRADPSWNALRSNPAFQRLLTGAHSDAPITTDSS